jgi:hypothetical protein
VNGVQLENEIARVSSGAASPEAALILARLAEGVGFEPTVPCSTAVFKTARISHSRTPPPIATVTTSTSGVNTSSAGTRLVPGL